MKKPPKGLPKGSPKQRQFVNELQREYDRLDEIRADKIVYSIIIFIIGIIIYSIFS
jgi:dolichol kinase